MSRHWEYPIIPKRLPTTECEDCQERVIVVVTPTLTASGIQMAVHCSKCLVMLNMKQNVQLVAMPPDILFKAVGCRPLPHPTRYNPKYNFGVSNWLAMRWRQY